MSITLEVGGRRYGNWTNVEVTRSMDEVSGTFNFSAASDYKAPFPIPRGQAVKVFVNNTQVLTGYVDRITVNYSAGSHELGIAGRDKTADIVDSKVDHKIEFTAPITLEDVAKQTLSSIGANDIQVINKVSGLEPFVKGELVSAAIGDTAFEFIDQYARKRQVVIATDGYGNLVFTRASTESTNMQLNNVVGGKSNTIKSGTVSYDDSDRFSEYTFYSQGNPAGDRDAEEDSKQLTTRSGSYTDSEVRSSRKYHEIAESSSKEEPLEARAKWEGQIRKARSFSYQCEVVGHSPTDNGEAYSPNTLVNVRDDFCDVRDELLIVKVVYKLGSNTGSTTSLEMLTKEAYSLLQRDKERHNRKDASKETRTGPKPVDTNKYATANAADAKALKEAVDRINKR